MDQELSPKFFSENSSLKEAGELLDEMVYYSLIFQARKKER